jgi:hypothetical protein
MTRSLTGGRARHLVARNEFARALVAMFPDAGTSGRQVHLTTGARLGHLLVDTRIVNFRPVI